MLLSHPSHRAIVYFAAETSARSNRTAKKEGYSIRDIEDLQDHHEELLESKEFQKVNSLMLTGS